MVIRGTIMHDGSENKRCSPSHQELILKNRLRISAHVAVAVPFALLAACGSSPSGSGTPGMGGTPGTGSGGTGGATSSQAGGAGGAGTAGIGGQSCAAWIACCRSLGDTGCVSAAQAIEAQAAAGTISEAALEAACKGNLQILAMVNAQKCGGTGGAGDGGASANPDGGAGGGASGAGGSAGRATGGTTGSVDAGGSGGAGGAGQAAWTCNEGAGNCACEAYPLFSATSCSAGPYSCCKAGSAGGIGVCTCTNTITAANCAAAAGGAVVAHCPP
jgi:hypothetical protein